MARLAVLVLCGAAAAQDLLTPGEQVLAELRDALAAADDARAIALLGEVGGLVRYPASAAEADALVALAGEAARSKRAPVVVAALVALGECGAPAARAHVEPHLRAIRKGEEAVVLAAVRAAGKLRAPALIPNLLDLAKQANNLVVAEQALLALGEFRAAETDVRARVMRETLALCQSLEKRREWTRLRASGLRALQRLTDRRLNSVQMFEDWWRHAKAKKDPFE